MATSFVFLVLVVLGIGGGRAPVEATKPTAASARAVEDLVVTSGTVTFETVDYSFDEKPPLKILGTETRPYALVCGVWDTGGDSQRHQFVDFYLERKDRNASEAKWTKVSVKPVNEVLERAKDFEISSIDPASTDPVFTAPLPKLQKGVWKDAGHPRLDDIPVGRLLLFRFPDFDVQEGHEYRYRVRLQTIEGKKSGRRSRIFWTAWSEPSRWIKI